MAGTATNTIRSAYVVSDPTGAFPATPAFKTMPAVIDMQSEYTYADNRSQISRGARNGQSIIAADIKGTLTGPLIYGVYDDWFATLMQNNWSANSIKNGEAPNSMPVENSYPQGAGGDLAYLRFPGVEATSCTLKLASQKEAEISFEFFGVGASLASETAIVGATYTDPTEFNPISSGLGVGVITMGAYEVDCIGKMEINLTFEGRESQPKIGNETVNGVHIQYCGVSRGALMAVITAKLYVENGFVPMFNASRADPQTPFALTIPLGSVTGKKYLHTFPRCFFAGSTTDISGASMMHDVTIFAHFDDVTDCVMQTTRAVA